MLIVLIGLIGIQSKSILVKVMIIIGLILNLVRGL